MGTAKICYYTDNKDVIYDCYPEREYFAKYENALKHLEKLKIEQEINNDSDIFRIDSEPREIIFSDDKYGK